MVAFETAGSPELRAALIHRASGDAETVFALLVPATPGRHLLFVRDGKATEVAQQVAQSAKRHLETAGLTITEALAGKAAPLAAIADELAANPGYASIIICTHPADVSRWLKAGVPQKARRFGLPVTHIVVKSVAEAAGYRVAELPPEPSTPS